VTAAALAALAAALAAVGSVLVLPAPVRRRRGRRLGLMRALAAAGALGGLRRARAPAGLGALILAAGRPGGLGTRELMAAKVGALVAGAAAGAFLGALAPGRLGPLLALAGPAAGFLAPDLWLRRRAAERARHVRRELPYLLDLLRVTVEAGMPLGAAMRAVGERASGPLAREWRAVGREVALGVPLRAALAGMRARAPVDEVRALITALERASRHGAPLGDALAAQARDARLARRRRIQEEAARAGPQIQLVVALLLVPSVLLLVAAALAAALLGRGSAVMLG
jgi:tight adherence protein C